MREDEIGEGLVECGLVGSRLAGYGAGLAAFHRNGVDLALGSGLSRGLVENRAFGIGSVVFGDVGGGIREGFPLFTVGRYPVQLVVPPGFAGPDQGSVGKDFPLVRNLYIGCVFFFQPQTGSAVQTLGVEPQVVLQSVQHHKRQFVFGRPLHAGKVFVFQPGRHGGDGLFGEGIRMERHLGIGFSRFGVFELLLGGIQFGTVYIHAKRGDVGFVEPQKSEIFAVGRPPQRDVKAEFLFVHPIRGAVDNAVAHSVRGHGPALSRGHLKQPNVVVFHVGHPFSVGGKLGILDGLVAQ